MSIEKYSAIFTETQKVAHYLHKHAKRGLITYHGEAVETDCGTLRLIQLVVYGANERMMRHVQRTYPLALIVYAA